MQQQVGSAQTNEAGGVVSHTQGEWAYCFEPYTNDPHSAGYVVFAKCELSQEARIKAGLDHYRRQIAVVEVSPEPSFIGRSYHDQGKSNARLIANAPRLLSALQQAVEQYGKPGGPWNVPNESGTWIESARAALAAVTGSAE